MNSSQSQSLRIDGLGVRFGKFHAIRDVSMRFDGPGVHSVIGPNGAGKTTFFNALSGLVPSSGRIFIGEREVSRMAPATRRACGMARSFQITSLFEDETVLENVRLAVQSAHSRPVDAFRGYDRDPAIVARARQHIAFMGLEKHADAPVSTLSHGLKRIVDLTLCVASDAGTILLDEPTSGIGIDDVPRLRRLIATLGKTHLVILIEHNMGVVLEISKSIAVLVRGGVLATGTPDEIRRNESVQAAYLGGKHAAA